MSDRIEPDRVAAAAIALLSLTRHDGNRVWKGFDWDVMNDLHERGWITDPVGKAKSVVLTDEGVRQAKRAVAELFVEAPRVRRPRGAASSRRQDPVEDWEQVVVLRCTAKLLRELRFDPIEVPSEIPEGRQWHANLLRLERKKCFLLTHTPTLYSLVLLDMRRERSRRLAEVFFETLSRRLANDGLAFDDRLLPSNVRLVYAKTNSRSVLGSMNDLAFQLSHRVEWEGGLDRALRDDAWARINEIPMIRGLGGRVSREAMVSYLRETMKVPS